MHGVPRRRADEDVRPYTNTNPWPFCFCGKLTPDDQKKI